MDHPLPEFEKNIGKMMAKAENYVDFVMR